MTDDQLIALIIDFYFLGYHTAIDILLRAGKNVNKDNIKRLAKDRIEKINSAGQN